MPAFHEAARLLIAHVNLHNLRWRQHGLGMIQAELSESLRVHIWHPRLRTFPISSFKPGSSFREIHDHRFDLTSAVLVGEIIDVQFHIGSAEASRFEVEKPNDSWGWHKTQIWEIDHAKIQQKHGDGSESGHKLLREASVGMMHSEGYWPVYRAGSAYTIPRRVFHTTRVNDLAVTMVHRENFDDRPARILGNEEEAAKSGMIFEDINTSVLKAWAIKEAEDALYNLRG